MEPGKHLILDLYGCEADLLNDYEKLKELTSKESYDEIR